METQPNALRLIACPWPLSIEKDRIDRLVPAGSSIAGYLRQLGMDPDSLSARVYIDGQLIESAYWERVKPKAGHALVIRTVPMGGEGGKTALRIVGMIAIVVAATALSQPEFYPEALAMGLGPTGASFVAAGFAIGGSLEINHLIRRPEENRHDEPHSIAPR